MSEWIEGSPAMKDALEQIRRRFFLPEEFPLLSRDQFPPDCLRQAMAVDPTHLAAYAAARKGTQLEGLMLDLITAQHSGEIRRGVEILCIRSTRRIRRLAELLCQYHWELEGISLLCAQLLLTAKGTAKEEQILEHSFLSRFGTVENKIKALAEALLQEGQDLATTCHHYGILTESPLAQAAFYEYFIDCDKTGMLINHTRLLHLIKDLPKERLVQLAVNYLSCLSLVELHDDVNEVLQERLGDPLDSMEWDQVPLELRQKFTKWSFLNRLKLHTKDTPAKFRCLAKYYDEILTSWDLTEHETMVIDFGHMVLADRRYSPDSFFYERHLFEEELRHQEGVLPTFLGNGLTTVTARQFMLMGLEAPCIRFTYEGIHRYYLDEVMEIKLGLEPDMRRLRSKRKLKDTSQRYPHPREPQ